jgi:general secretion pathway protein H
LRTRTRLLLSDRQRSAVSRQPSAGFTLIELLVVIVIIGLVAATAVLATGVLGRDSQLETESERLLTLVGYAREQAEMQTREYGLRIETDGYEFLAFDPRRGIWAAVEEDDILRARELPDGLEIALVIEGRRVLLRPPREKEERLPHVMLFSNGDITPFEITLRREGSSEVSRMASEETGEVVAVEPEGRR